MYLEDYKFITNYKFFNYKFSAVFKMSFAENFHNYCILSRFLSPSHYVTSTCAIATRLTHIHTLHFSQLNYSARGFKYNKLRHIHTNMHTHVQDREQNAAAVLTLTMCGIVRRVSLVLESHTLQRPPNFTSHTLFFLHPKSSAARSHLQACLLFTHTTRTSCEELQTATLTISKSNWVREIHFGFFLFCSLDVLWGSCYGDGTQRQLRQPMYTRVGRALSLSLWVCVFRFVCPA